MRREHAGTPDRTCTGTGTGAVAAARTRTRTGAARVRALLRDERGSASLEFVTVGLVLLVPLIYLVVALGTIQEHSLGVEAAARHTARAIALAGDAAAAGERGDAVLIAVAAQYGIDPGELAVAITCVPAASTCPAAGATVMVSVRARVTLPLVPAVLGLERIASVPVAATAVQKMSRFWGGAP